MLRSFFVLQGGLVLQTCGKCIPWQVVTISIDGKIPDEMHRADLYRFGGKRGIIFAGTAAENERL